MALSEHFDASGNWKLHLGARTDKQTTCVGKVCLENKHLQAVDSCANPGASVLNQDGDREGSRRR